MTSPPPFTPAYLYLVNTDTSQESKDHSKHVLGEIGSETTGTNHGSYSSYSGTTTAEGKNPDNVARGYKAYTYSV